MHFLTKRKVSLILQTCFHLEILMIIRVKVTNGDVSQCVCVHIWLVTPAQVHTGHQGEITNTVQLGSSQRFLIYCKRGVLRWRGVLFKVGSSFLPLWILNLGCEGRQGWVIIQISSGQSSLTVINFIVHFVMQDSLWFDGRGRMDKTIRNTKVVNRYPRNAGSANHWIVQPTGHFVLTTWMGGHQQANQWSA